MVRFHKHILQIIQNLSLNWFFESLSNAAQLNESRIYSDWGWDAPVYSKLKWRLNTADTWMWKKQHRREIALNIRLSSKKHLKNVSQLSCTQVHYQHSPLHLHLPLFLIYSIDLYDIHCIHSYSCLFEVYVILSFI